MIAPVPPGLAAERTLAVVTRAMLVLAVALVACKGKGVDQACADKREALAKLFESVAAERAASPPHPSEMQASAVHRRDLAIVDAPPADWSKANLLLVDASAVELLTANGVEAVPWDPSAHPDDAPLPAAPTDQPLVIAASQDAGGTLVVHLLASARRAGHTNVALAFRTPGKARPPLERDISKIAAGASGEATTHCPPIATVMTKLQAGGGLGAPELQALAAGARACDCAFEPQQLEPIAFLASTELVTLVPVKFADDGAPIPASSAPWSAVGSQVAGLARRGAIKIDEPPPPPPPAARP